ncbi:type VI secretion system tube protein Hcp (plasmid) [Hafnia alvei]|uniref:Hcp family type VI secretion system effector n=1 Tax=Hafnia alvei TaxID=569 RepID=UPI000B68FFED|nr:type VI secretion system tube protein Hcp [Hafnia alvei]MBI0278605.1 type VI secretion system tube protein Hcp [Hafnia alvei]PNL03900.1 Hcp1 family type VI secretion system effector [Hafnia alvei]
MATTANLFMQIDGIKGCVSDKKYEGWIAINHANNGVYSTAKINNGSGQLNSEGVNFDAVSFSKEMDATSTDLVNMVAQGSNIKKIIIAMNVKTEDKDNEMVRWTYENCILTSNTIAAQSSGDIPFENLSFVFSNIKFETQMVEAGGQPKKYGPVGWSLTENTKL